MMDMISENNSNDTTLTVPSLFLLWLLATWGLEGGLLKQGNLIFVSRGVAISGLKSTY